jgi:hypothetical protein
VKSIISYNPCEHPAPELLFAAVAALQHLTDAHDADNVSPPPIWPMVLHGAMPDLFIFDDEDDLLGCLRVCFAAIKAERRILTLVYIRSAQHILSRRPYQPVPGRGDVQRSAQPDHAAGFISQT